MRRRKQENAAPGFGITVGIITNSDNRVPSILHSLGLSVRPLNLGGPQWDFTQVNGSVGEAQDIDFVALSYDIGFEKPDRRVFDAVKEMMKQVEDVDCEFLHVGDDLEKDVNGAKAAGWESLLLDREMKYVDASAHEVQDMDELRKLLAI